MSNNNDNNVKRPLDDKPNDANGVKRENAESTDDQHELEPQPCKKTKYSEEELDIRFLVSTKEAGAIIGKGGSNINHLRKHYKSSVTIPDCFAPERVLSIVATLDTLGDILKDVIGFVDDRAQSNVEHDVELRMLIHTSHAGGIIGKGGFRIKELRDQTKAAIKVFSQCCPHSTERVCAVQGNAAIVIEAIKTILDIILASPIKGPVKLYDPFNFDIYSASEYGGFVEVAGGNYGRRGGHGGGGHGMNGPGHGHSYGGGGGGGQRGGYSRMPRRDAGAGHRGELSPWQHNFPPQMQAPPPHEWIPPNPRSHYNGPADRRGPGPGPNQMYSHSDRWISSSESRHMPPQATQGSPDDTPYWSDALPSENPPPSSHPNQPAWSSAYHPSVRDNNNGGGGDVDVKLTDNPDGTSSATLAVPNSVAGAIIGKGGSRIRNVRRDSGADISIDSSVGPGNERMITIKGSPQQVHIAHSLLRKSIAENTRRY